MTTRILDRKSGFKVGPTRKRPAAPPPKKSPVLKIVLVVLAIVIVALVLIQRNGGIETLFPAK